MRRQYSSAKDPVNMAGYVAGNILEGQVRIIHWREIASLSDETLRIDVRTQDEFAMGTIPGFVNIPLDELSANTSMSLPRGNDRLLLRVPWDCGAILHAVF